jgi:hypothetical protein
MSQRNFKLEFANVLSTRLACFSWVGKHCANCARLGLLVLSNLRSAAPVPSLANVGMRRAGHVRVRAHSVRVRHRAESEKCQIGDMVRLAGNVRRIRYQRRPQPPLHLLPHPPPPRKSRTTRRSNIAPMVALTIALITPVPRCMPS